MLQQGNLREIWTIFGNMAEHIAKFLRIENMAITFIKKEADRVLQPQNKALVVSLKIENNLVHRVLIENRSYADIIFKSALDKMNLEVTALRPVKTPLTICPENM